MESLERMSLQQFSGFTKRSLESLKERLPPEEQESCYHDLDKFLFGSARTQMSRLLPSGPGHAVWASKAKRCVQLTMAKDALQFCLRANQMPSQQSMLGLSGKDPYQASAPWVATKLVKDILLYEIDPDALVSARNRETTLPKRLGRKIRIVEGDIFDIQQQYNFYVGSFGVIDLDFCSNKLKYQDKAKKIAELTSFAATKNGLTILSITLHVGRVHNSKEDVLYDIDNFEGLLKEKRFRIRARMEYPYQSSMPMLAMLWILDRKQNEIVVL